MTSYIVEVSLPEAVAAKRIDAAIRTTGSHFATRAEWRRTSGIRLGRLVVEASDTWGAIAVVPPGMRAQATVIPFEPVTTGAERATRPNAAMTSLALAA